MIRSKYSRLIGMIQLLPRDSDGLLSGHLQLKRIQIKNAVDQLIMVFKGLCLSGGGIAGFVHLGLLRYLENKNLTKGIDVIVCTSVGAIIGSMLAVGLTSDKIYDHLITLNHDILQYTTIEEFFTRFGLDSGEYFMAELADIFLTNGVSPVITFDEVQMNYNKCLIITGTNLNKQETTYFSPETHGKMRILDAVRISIGIPFLFTVSIYSDEFYVDGGITDNYPLHHCLDQVRKVHPDLHAVENHVIGSYIESMPTRKITNLEDFIYNIFACMLNRSKGGCEALPSTVFTSLKDVSSLEFNADKTKRETMFRLGFQGAQDYVETVWFSKFPSETTTSSFYLGKFKRPRSSSV